MRLPSRSVVALLVFTLAVAAAPRVTATADPAPPEVVDRILAVVDEDIVTSTEVARRAAPLLRRSPDADARARDAIADEVLERIIDERAIAHEAEDLRVSVTTDEIDRAIEAVATSQQVTPAELERAVADAGLTLAAYRSELRAQLFEAKLMQIQVMPALQRDPPLTGAALSEALTKARPAWIEGLRDKVYIERRTGR